MLKQLADTTKLGSLLSVLMCVQLYVHTSCPPCTLALNKDSLLQYPGRSIQNAFFIYLFCFTIIDTFQTHKFTLTVMISLNKTLLNHTNLLAILCLLPFIQFEESILLLFYCVLQFKTPISDQKKTPNIRKLHARTQQPKLGYSWHSVHRQP